MMHIAKIFMQKACFCFSERLEKIGAFMSEFKYAYLLSTPSPLRTAFSYKISTSWWLTIFTSSTLSILKEDYDLQNSLPTSSILWFCDYLQNAGGLFCICSFLEKYEISFRMAQLEVLLIRPSSDLISQVIMLGLRSFTVHHYFLSLNVVSIFNHQWSSHLYKAESLDSSTKDCLHCYLKCYYILWGKKCLLFLPIISLFSFMKVFVHNCF